MAKIINLIFVLFLYTSALAQIGGTRATTDTMRLADKFAVYKIALGQRLDASKANTDTIQVTALLDVPEGGLPACNSSRQGNLMMNTSNNRLYFCNGSSWGLVAYDADLDGLTSAIDANEAVAFTAGTAAASNVMSGFTFYTGAGMTETTGSIPTYGGALSNGGSISSGSYTPANFPFTLQTNDDYVDKDLTINNPTNLAASNVRVGVAIAGNTGTYPSSGNRLNGNTVTTDISAGTVRTGYEGFQSDGTLITGSIPTYGGAISPSGSISSGSYTPSSFPFTLQTDDDYVDKNLTINNPTNLSATNVRVGVAIAGNTGTYPSSGNRLNGNTATTDVTAATLLEANEGFQSDGTLVTGSMPNNGAGSFTSDGSKPAGYYSSITVDVVASGTADTDAGGGQILSGYEAWNSTGGLVDGTMPDNGTATFDTDGAKSAGYYSSITVDVIHPGTGDVNASGAQILTGYEAWSEVGDLVDGTMPNRGSVTFDTDGVKNTGYYSGIEVDVIDAGTGDTNAGGGQILSGYEAWSELGSLVDGTMPNNGAGSFTSDGSKPAGYYSSINVDVVASGTADTDAAGGQILTGYEAWNSTGGLVDGTMPNRGAPTFSTDDVSLDAGYYSGGTINVISSGTADTDASGAQILTGYEAWNSTGGVVDGTMPNKGAGSFTADGSYTTGYAGYYSSINVDVVAAGTADTDAGGAQIRSGYEAWNSTGGLVDGTMVDQGGSTNTPVVGTGSYTVATGGRYLTGDVNINRVSATTSISHGGSSGDGPWKSVSCAAAGIGFSVSGPTGGSSGTSIGNGNQITITANEGGTSATYYCGGYSSCNSCCGCGDVGGAQCNCPTCGSCVGATISSPAFFAGQAGTNIPNGQSINVSTCSSYFEAHCNVTCPTCNEGLTSTADIQIYVGQNATVTANNGETRTVYCIP